MAQTDTEARTEGEVDDGILASTVEPEERDDLCQVKGVGPVRQHTLNNAGIYTWRQLGEMSPEAVRSIVNIADAEAWPARARELAT